MKQWFTIMRLGLVLLGLLRGSMALAQPTFVGSDFIKGRQYTQVAGLAYGPHQQSYVLVQFYDTVHIGQAVRALPPMQSGFERGALLVCFDSLHHVAWSRLVTVSRTPMGGRTTAMQVDGRGNVWVCGLVGSQLGVDSLQVEGSAATWRSTVNNSNVWVASYSATGTLRWATLLNEPCSALPPWLATTRSGSAYLVYTRYDQTVGGPPPPGSIPGSDVKLLKIDSTGQVLHRRLDTEYAYSPQSSARPWSYSILGMSCDPVTEHLYLTGLNSEAVSLGGVPLPAAQNGVRSPSLAAYAPDLTPLWTQRFPVQLPRITGVPNQLAAGLANLQIGPQGNVMATAYYVDHLTVDTVTFVHPNPALTGGGYGRSESQAVSFSAGGQLQWHTVLGPMGYPGRVSSSRPAIYYVHSTTSAPFAFGNYLALPGPRAAGGWDLPNAFVAALTATGTPLWLRQTAVDSTTTYITTSDMAVAADGDIVLSGTAPRPVAFGNASWQPSTHPNWPGNAFLFMTGPVSNTTSRLQFLPQVGAIGTTVVFNGRNFQAASTLTFNGVSATFRVNASGDQIVAQVPAGARTGLISISTPAGTQTSITAFRVSGSPLGTQAAALPTVQLFPNPATAGSTLTVASEAVVQQVTLCDALGRVVQQAAPSRPSPQLQLLPLAPGLYSVRIVTAAGSVVRRLVVE